MTARPSSPHVRHAVLICLVVVTLAACTNGDGGPGRDADRDGGGTATGSTSPTVTADGATFSGNGVTFTYPQDWHESTVTDASVSAGQELWAETVGIDDVNFAWIAGYRIDVPVTAEGIEQQARAIGADFGSLFAQAGGELTDGPEVVTLAGLPAVRLVGTAVTPAGATIESRVVLAFDGRTEYFVNCQYNEDGEAEIVEGCELIVSTFDVSG